MVPNQKSRTLYQSIHQCLYVNPLTVGTTILEAEAQTSTSYAITGQWITTSTIDHFNTVLFLYFISVV